MKHETFFLLLPSEASKYDGCTVLVAGKEKSADVDGEKIG